MGGEKKTISHQLFTILEGKGKAIIGMEEIDIEQMLQSMYTYIL